MLRVICLCKKVINAPLLLRAKHDKTQWTQYEQIKEIPAKRKHEPHDGIKRSQSDKSHSFIFFDRQNKATNQVLKFTDCQSQWVLISFNFFLVTDTITHCCATLLTSSSFDHSIFLRQCLSNDSFCWHNAESIKHALKFFALKIQAF